MRQYAHAVGRLHQDDGEGEGCRHPAHHEGLQGKIFNNYIFLPVINIYLSSQNNFLTAATDAKDAFLQNKLY